MNTAYIDALREEYIDNHTKEQIRECLIEENNVELRDVKGYHGREILELLQNADDAYQKSIDSGKKPDADLNVEITYLDGCLTVSNTGTCFDEDGIKAIVQGNNSPKTGKYIGNKGTGFRSILNWATAVRIYSGEFSVQFSKRFADEIFSKIKDKPQIAKQLKKRDNLYIPMLAVPENIKYDGPKDKTTIEVNVDPQKTNDEYSVERQLDSVDLRILLFLPNISTINITTSSKKVVYQRTLNDCCKNEGLMHKNVVLSKIVDDKIEYEEEFKLFNKTVEGVFFEDEHYKKDVQFAIAVPVGEKRPIEYLYSYFPLLDTDAPFDCVMHATYSLGDHRNTLVADETNKKICQDQLDFLFEIGVYLSKEDPLCAQSILAPKNFSYESGKIFPAVFSRLSLEEYYLHKLGSLKIFQTVTGKLLSIKEDAPRIIEPEFPECFKGEPFGSLLAHGINNFALIQILTGKLEMDISFGTDEMCEAINNSTEGWSIKEQVEVFIWWNEHGDKSSLPKLLKARCGKDTGRWLMAREDCYFLEGDFDSLVMPEWVKVTFLADDYQRELVAQVEPKLPKTSDDESGRASSVIRKICNTGIFSCLNFKYRDKSHALSLANSSVNDFGKAVEFVKWIWKYKIHPTKETSEPSQKTNYKFPSSDGCIVSQDKLYFGSRYGHKVSDSLFPDDYMEFPALDVFDVNDCDSIQFQEHFKEFGIVIYPKIELLDLKNLSPSYDERMKRKIEATGVYDYVGSTYIDKCQYKLPYIKDLQHVLQNLDMWQVVEWIMADKKLKEYLGYDVYPSNDRALVKYHGNNQYAHTFWDYSNAIDNYILYTFQNTPWVEVGGGKKSPIEVLDACTLRTNERYRSFLPVLTVKDIEAVAGTLKVGVEDVRSIFTIFSFPKYVTELSSDSFYGLMLALQETDILDEDSLLLSRAIYRIIEHQDFVRDFEDSANKRRFFEDGKLLVKQQGKLQYCPAKNAVLPSTKIINKKAFPIVEKGIRTNNKNFVRVFGCKEYINDYEIIPDTAKNSDLDTDFQKYFRGFIRYAKAFSEKNDFVGATVNDLKVILVESISIKENGEVLVVDSSYTLLKRSNKYWYIVINSPSYDRNRMSECIENIFANIANTPGFDASKIGELFRTDDLKTRDFLIVKEFGSLDVIDENLGLNHIKENFYKTLETLGLSMPEECEIDFDDFGSYENTASLVKFFRSVNIDLDKFTAAGFVYPIDVRGYWRREIENIIFENKQAVMSWLYANALNDKAMQEEFVEKINRFEDYAEHYAPNSVFYEPMDDMKKEFGDWTKSDTAYSVDDIYKTNFDKMNPNNLYPEVIGNDWSVQRMIFFRAEEDFVQWLQFQEKNASASLPDCGLKVYEKYKDVVPVEVNIVYSTRSDEREGTRDGASFHGVYSKKESTQHERRLKEIGNTGELLVYNYLCKKYGEENVVRRSEAFVQLERIKAGQAKSGGYDLSYRDGGKTVYVEVKTGEGNRIYLSQGEFDFACKHADNYLVYYVTDIKNKPKVSILEPKFWTDERYRKREIIESIEFTF